MCVFANLLLFLWCYSLKNKSNLLEIHAQISQHQCRLYLRKKIHFIRDFTRMLSVFSYGRAQHVRCMHSSIASVITSVLQFRSTHFFLEFHHTLVLTGDSSYISRNVISPFFSAKNTIVTAYLLESPLHVAAFTKFCLLFKNCCVLARVQIKNGNVNHDIASP